MKNTIPMANFQLQPVLPVVLYTGDRRWDNIESLADLVEASSLFAAMIPAFRPHFLNTWNLPRSVSSKAVFLVKF